MITDNTIVTKVVLRTGEWPVTPTTTGKLGKPLRVVRNGKSDPRTGVIALAELVENFGKAIERVQIPLSDDDRDHKNLTRLNTGFVRSVRIVDGDDGVSKLVAKLDFTEPDIREKVLRGTYADVSCGIPWSTVRQGRTYGAALEHVAITNRPFIDGLGPFLAASDDGRATIVTLADPGHPGERLTAAQKAAAVMAELRTPTEIRVGPGRYRDYDSDPDSVAERIAAAKEELRESQTIHLGPGDVDGDDPIFIAARAAAVRDDLSGERVRREARERAAQVAAEMRGR